MMAGKGCLLLQTDQGWWAIAPESGVQESWEDAAPPELAERLARFVARHGLANRVVLGVRSQSALAASFTAPPAERDRQTLSYQLESRLPVAAEDIVADFVRQGEQVLGVCIDVRSWQPLIGELESRRLRVQSISPTALLALQSLVNDRGWNPCDLVLWQDGGAIELWRTTDGTITTWQHLDADAMVVARSLTVETLTSGGVLRGALINGSAELRADLQAAGVQQIELRARQAGSLAEHAAQQADAVLRGAETPWIELRRGELAAGDPNRSIRGSLRLLAATAALFLITLTGAFFYRDWQYRSELAELTAEQAKQFAAAFPNTRVPAAVVARMRSEHVKLQASRHAEKDVKPSIPALRVLFELLQGLPAGQPFVVRELRIEDGQVDLDIHLRQHADVNQIVESLEARGFSVNAPATARQDDASVSSRIFGVLQFAGAEQEPRRP